MVRFLCSLEPHCSLNSKSEVSSIANKKSHSIVDHAKLTSHHQQTSQIWGTSPSRAYTAIFNSVRFWAAKSKFQIITRWGPNMRTPVILKVNRTYFWLGFRNDGTMRPASLTNSASTYFFSFFHIQKVRWIQRHSINFYGLIRKDTRVNQEGDKLPDRKT